MTPDEVSELIKKGPTEQLAARFAPLTEAERKRLSKTVVNLRKERTQEEMGREARRRLSTQPAPPCPHCGERLRSALARQCFACGKSWHDESIPTAPTSPWTRQAECRLQLATFAVGPWAEVRRLRVWQILAMWHQEPKLRDWLFQIICDRKPDWMENWVKEELEQSQQADWQFVRRLVRAGVCPKPQTESYTLQMVLGFYSADRTKSLKDRILEDPELLENEIWNLFEVSPARRTIFYISDITDEPRAGYPCFSWSTTLRELMQEGKLDRQRLLSASLGSLLRNTEARNTTWFCRFHELLAPTESERQFLQATYLQLLSHPVPAVAGAALDALALLEKRGNLDIVGFVAAVPSVFHLRPKGPPLAAIKLIRRILTCQKDFESNLADVLVDGLSNPTTDVQEAILEVLTEHRDRASALISERLPDRIDSLAPSNQERARKLLAGSALITPIHEAGDNGLLAEAARIAPEWRRLSGIDAILSALEGKGELSAVQFDSLAVPRLDPDKRVHPIRSLDELIERLTIAVEGLTDGIEFELLLDGLARLCDQRPDDFSMRVAPLVKRVQKLTPDPRFVPLNLEMMGLRAVLFKLILLWCDQEVPDTKEERTSLTGFLEVRVGMLKVRIRERRAVPLLACPTHQGGWIEPAELANRMRCCERLGMEPSSHDFIQALLRLAPDGRAGTLAQARDLHGKYAPAFRYALGGALEPSSLSAAVMIAAGRARTPFAELSELQSFGALTGPDATAPARYLWSLVPFAVGSQHEGIRLRVHVEPDEASYETVRDLPCVLLHDWRPIDGVNRWAATVWPANPQPFFAAGARLRLESWLLRQRAAYLEPFFDPNVPFSEIAQILLAQALGQAEPEVTGLAVDVLIELVRDGRCVGQELGAVLRQILPSDFVKFNRLGKQLEATARASPLHAHVCAQIVQTACLDVAADSKELHFFFSPLLEWLTLLGQSVRDDFRPMLEQPRTGKTATLAKKLLQLKATPANQSAYLRHALEGRLTRAKLWERLSQVVGVP